MAHTQSHTNPPPGATSAGTARIAVLTDAHVASAADPREPYLRAVLDVARSLPAQPDLLVFLGDLRAAGRGDASIRGRLNGWLRDWPYPYHVLRGNTDIDAPPARFVHLINGWLIAGVDTAEGIYSDKEDQWLEATLLAAKGAPVILTTHYHPEALDPQSQARLRRRLEQSGIRVLICGHGHRAEVGHIDATALHLIGPVDPYKPGHEQPGLDLLVITPQACQREHRPVSLIPSSLSGEGVEQWLGFAVKAKQVERHLPKACDHSLRMVQVKQAQDVSQITTVAQLLREGRLTSASLHISTPRIQPDLAAANRDQLDRECAIAVAMGASSVTTHLPTWDARQLFDESEQWRDGDVGNTLVRALSDLWSGFWREGIRIDVENTHWYDPAEQPDFQGEHQLGIRPAHLLAFRERVEAALRCRWGDVPGAGVACCLDVGHVLTNGPLAEQFPLSDWFEALDFRIASFHLHDVTADPRGRYQGHFALGAANGLMNIEGFLSLRQRHAPSAAAYLEMDEVEDVLKSVAHIHRWFAHRDQPQRFAPRIVHDSIREK